MSDLKQLGSLAKEASRVLATMGTNEKNHALTMVADGLEADAEREACRRDFWIVCS